MTSYTENVNTDEGIAVVNGHFDVDADWDKGPWWTIGGGTADIDVGGGFEFFLTQIIPALIAGNVYDIRFTISASTWDAGNGIRITLGKNVSPDVRKENGQHTVRVEAGNVNQTIQFSNRLLTVGVGCSIDDVVITAVSTNFMEDLGIDHRPIRGAVRYSVPDGDKIYHALSYKDKTNCYIKYTP